MKHLSLATLSLMLMASPAMALKITNLDSVAHKVELSGRGAPEVRVIQPNATEYFRGASQGFLALVDDAPTGAKKATKKSTRDSIVHADGLLSGVIGNERTSRIPADPDNGYVIWQGGKITVQSRMKVNRGR